MPYVREEWCLDRMGDGDRRGRTAVPPPATTKSYSLFVNSAGEFKSLNPLLVLVQAKPPRHICNKLELCILGNEINKSHASRQLQILNVLLAFIHFNPRWRE